MGSAIEVDHPFNRGTFAGLKCSKIGFGHLSERVIMFVLSRVPENLWRRRLKNRETQQRHLIPECDGERCQAAE